MPRGRVAPQLSKLLPSPPLFAPSSSTFACDDDLDCTDSSPPVYVGECSRLGHSAPCDFDDALCVLDDDDDDDPAPASCLRSSLRTLSSSGSERGRDAAPLEPSARDYQGPPPAAVPTRGVPRAHASAASFSHFTHGDDSGGDADAEGDLPGGLAPTPANPDAGVDLDAGFFCLSLTAGRCDACLAGHTPANPSAALDDTLSSGPHALAALPIFLFPGGFACGQGSANRFRRKGAD